MRIHLLDGTYELFRGFFGAPSYVHRGREVAATRVVLMAVARLVKTKVATHLGVAFDTVIESFRNELFAGYKTGEGIPEPLHSQFELVERAIAAFGVRTWGMIEFEADDAVATAAATCARDERVEQVVITAVDKDMCQCVRGDRVVCWDRWKDVTLDEAGVLAKHGVPPSAIPDYLALVGDTADGIPGIPGWGKSTAAKLLVAYGSLEAIPADPKSWTASGVRGTDKLAAVLSERRADALLYKRLATLREDCPIPCTVEDLAWRGPADADALAGICDELGMDPAKLLAPATS